MLQPEERNRFYVRLGKRKLDRKLAEGNVAIVDIGGYTTDVLTFHTLDLGPIYSSVALQLLHRHPSAGLRGHPALSAR
jgi:hypothetical protein